MPVKKIAVLGVGLMGHGIAQVASQVGGFEVKIYARNTQDKGLRMISDSLEIFKNKQQITQTQVDMALARIHKTHSLEEAVGNADFVIESIPENIKEKLELFRTIDKLTQPETIIVSGTSSINITALSSALSCPSNFCGMHFFNPPQIMKLVEVIKGEKTSNKTLRTVLNVAHRMGKETIVVKKNSPGFIVNRILLPALNEAATIYDEGLATKEDIDKAVRLALGWPMGPLRLIDYIGLDTILAITQILEKETGDFKTSECIKQMVKANRLGKKTSHGFYKWPKKMSRKPSEKSNVKT